MAQKRKRPKSLYRRMKDSAQVQAALTVILPVLLGIVIIALWQTQVLHHWFKTDTFTLPLITRIGKIFLENFGKIKGNIAATMMQILLERYAHSEIGGTFILI